MTVEISKDTIRNTVNELSPELIELSEYIYHHPELGHEEVLSSKAHVELLEKHGFEVEYPYLNINTAFKAVYDSGKEGPTIAFLSEYDALPGIGHGCGHNLLGATESGAGITLSKMIEQTGGRVMVFGTPAEETNGDKVDMAEAGVFSEVDVALGTHPSDHYFKSGSSMAMHAIQFEFFGKTAHAAAAPFRGKNALDACINTFNNINALRQQIQPTARVHGVIKEGGEAANVIPDYTRAEFYVRSEELPYLNELRDKVIRCAQAGADASACEMKWDYYEKSYKNLITNQILSETFNSNMKELGIEMVSEEEKASGSMDMGDVSQIVPTINPYYEITNGKIISAHTTDFRDCTLTEEAYEAMRNTIVGLNLTALDVITNENLLEEIKKEFEANVFAE